MKTDTHTPGSPLRRFITHRRRALLLVCFLVCAGSAAWLTGMFHSGLRVPEVHLLTEVHTAPARVESGKSLPLLIRQPLARMFLRLSPQSVLLPESVRLIPVLAGILSVVLLFLTARHSPGRTTSTICLVLAFSCVLLMTASQTFDTSSCSLAGLMCVQCACTFFDARPSWYRALVYLFSMVLGVLLTPLALALIGCHALWFLLRSIHSAFSSVTRKSLPLYLSATLLCLVLPTLAIMTAGFPIQVPDVTAALAAYPSAVGSGIAAVIAGRTVSLSYPGIALAGILGLAFLAAVLSCLVNRSRIVCAWILISLLIPGCLLLGMPPNPAGFPAAFLLLTAPFILLLCAEGTGFIITTVLKFSERCRKKPAAIFLYSAVVLAGIVVVLLWFTSQDAAYRLISARRALSDLSLSAIFLRNTLATGDTLYVSYSTDAASLPETKYYLTPYLDTDCPAQIIRQKLLLFSALADNAAKDGKAAFWAVGPGLESPPVFQDGWSTVYIPFVIPVLHAQRAAGSNHSDIHRFLQEIIQHYPNNPAMRTPMYTWYASVQMKELLAHIYSDEATRDLAAAGVLESQKPILKKAVSRVVTCWTTRAHKWGRADSYIFDHFIKAIDGIPLDTNQVVAAFTRFAKNALAESNYFWSIEMISSALRIDPKNISLLRLASQNELKRIPPQPLNAIEFNNRAREAYQSEYGRPFFDAWFANVLIRQDTNHYRRTITEFIALQAAALQEQARVTALYTNAPPPERPALMSWNTQCVFWEGQCNSYISHILTENGQYSEAIEWINKNLDKKFNPNHRKVAGDRLITLYEKSKDFLGLFAHIDSLISNAATSNVRLNWLIEKAHRQVTFEDPVGAYESLQRIYARLAKLPAGERHTWSSDPRFKRVYRHIESQMKTDVRDAVIPVLLKRANADSSSGWYYTQAAQLYRCQLKYAKAQETFKTGTRNIPGYVDNYLDGALMQYQLKRYPKASPIFTNMLQRVDNCEKVLAADWRFQVLSEFTSQRRPARMDDVLAWAAANRSVFSSDAQYRNYAGNVYALFGEYDRATNEFFNGFSKTEPGLDNYLDAGYLLCVRGNVAGVEKILNSINSLKLNKTVIERLDTDWRYIELYHVSGRPYSLKE